MAMRKFPYGYVMQRGIITVSDPEAETIRWIFQNRAAGKSNWEMARELYAGDDAYFKDSIRKSSCKISSILYDARYIGADGFPVILDKDLFDAVQALKGKPWMEKQTPRTVEGRTADEKPVQTLKSTTYIPTKGVFEREKAMKAMFRADTMDADEIRASILELASEKYNCIR